MIHISRLLFALLISGLLACQASTSNTTNAAVAKAYAQQQSRVWLSVEGSVSKVLPDDNKGSRHQRFILKLSPNHTLLVAHNIDLAPYVPLKLGDTITARGRYEWNKKGGVLHWTHHDPKGKKAGGWVELNGQRYR